MRRDKDQRKRNLIYSHGWLGVIFSAVLFLVFWAGAISLFRAELQQWAELPHYIVNPDNENVDLQTIIENKLNEFDYNTNEHIGILLPSEHRSNYLLYVDTVDANNDPVKHQTVALRIDPKTGETIGDADQFPLANFIFRLHYNLNLSRIGLYFIGVVTLFFFFSLVSGIYIYAKKVFSNFFVYRVKKKRTQFLDLHKVIGVISLPYTLMYAVTGLVFNLLIIYQIALVVFVYKGDTESIAQDAGFPIVEQVKLSGRPMNMKAGFDFIHLAEQRYGDIRFVRFEKYGDESASVQIRGSIANEFASDYNVIFRIKDGSQLFYSDTQNNRFQQGYAILRALHYGDYAGVDLRMIYFTLAMSVSVLIVAGNLVWVEKRIRQPSLYSRSVNIVSSMTLGSCMGVVLATALGLMLERVVPAGYVNRSDVIISVFTSTVLLTIAAAFFIRLKRRLLGWLLCMTSLLLMLTPMLGWLSHWSSMGMLWEQGQRIPHIVDGVLMLLSVLSFYCGRRFCYLQTEGAKTAFASL